jgi:colanic acid/amylovoran biosynthesis protein
MHTIQRVRANLYAALSGTALSQAIAGVAQVMIVRTLGVDGYGRYTLVYAWLAIVAAVMGAGLDMWLLDSVSRQPALLRRSLGRVIVIKISIGLGCIGIIWHGGWGVIPNPWLLSIGFVAVCADSLSATLWQGLRALGQHRTVAILQSVAMGLLLAGVVAGAAQGVALLLALQATVALVMLGGAGICVWQQMPAVTTATAVQLRHGVPFVISDILAQLYTYSSTLLLGGMASMSAVGVFRGAWSLIGYSFVVPAVIFTTTLPQLNAPNPPAVRKKIIATATGLLALYAIGMGLFAWLGAPLLLPWLYGPSYQASAQMVGQLALVPLAKAGSFLGVLLLVHQKRLRVRIGIQAVIVASLWLTAPWLIAQAGIQGAIQSQLFCEGLLAAGYLVSGVVLMAFPRQRIWPPQHIYVSNMHGVANVGDLAIHQQQIQRLTDCFPTAHITLAYHDRTGAQRVFPHQHVVNGLSHWVYADEGGIAPLRTRIRRTVVWLCAIPLLRWGVVPRWGLRAGERATLQAIADADVVYASGGGYLYDTHSRGGVGRVLSWDWYLLADMLTAIAIGCPLVLLPQSFGPCHNPWFRRMLVWVIRHAQRVYARESLSSAWLSRHGIVHRSAPDCAWGMMQPVPIAPHTPLILGITVINWGAQSQGFAGQVTYETVMTQVITHYLSHGWQVQLFVQCHEANPSWDDGQVAQRIAQRINHPAVHLMPFIADPTNLQQAYAQLDCLLTTRLHGAILRLGTAQSAVVIGYLPKAQGIMADMGLGAWCLDIDTATPNDIIAAIDNRDAQLPLIATALPTIGAAQQLLWDEWMHENPGITPL